MTDTKYNRVDVRKTINFSVYLYRLVYYILRYVHDYYMGICLPVLTDVKGQVCDMISLQEHEQTCQLPPNKAIAKF